MSWLSFLLARVLIKGVKHAGLVNLVAGKRLVPELLQEDATPGKIADTVMEMMKNRKKLNRLKKDLLAVKNTLGHAGASDRVADIAINML